MGLPLSLPNPAAHTPLHTQSPTPKAAVALTALLQPAVLRRLERARLLINPPLHGCSVPAITTEAGPLILPTYSETSAQRHTASDWQSPALKTSPAPGLEHTTLSSTALRGCLCPQLMSSACPGQAGTEGDPQPGQRCQGGPWGVRRQHAGPALALHQAF